MVTVDARVVQKDGRPLALPVDVAKEHFKVWEDGVPQHIQSVTLSQAPITAVLLVEFAATNYNFMYDALNASYIFASNLQPQDWVAVVEFDMKDPHPGGLHPGQAGHLRRLEHAADSRLQRDRTSSTRCTTPSTGWIAFPATRNWWW